MAGAVVDDPEHPRGRGVGLGGHDLGDQAPERGDAGRRLAAAEQAGLVHVPGRQVGERPAALVLVLDPHRPRHTWWQASPQQALSSSTSRRLLVRRHTRNCVQFGSGMSFYYGGGQSV
jgi:hypothetical protein